MARSLPVFCFLAAQAWMVAPTACAQTPSKAPPAASAPAEAALSGPVNLLEGARWEYSQDDGQTWQAQGPIVPYPECEMVLARVKFDLADPAGLRTLELPHGQPERNVMAFWLNGQRVPLPQRGMYYKSIYAIPATLLKKGRNELVARIGYDNRVVDWSRGPEDVQIALPTTLLALRDEHVRILGLPVLGAAGEDYFTATIRANMPCEAELRYGPAGADPAEFKLHVASGGGRGLFHRFKVEGLKPGVEYGYYCLAKAGKAADRSPAGAVRTMPGANKLRFVTMGDAQTVREDWAAVAAAIARAKPDLVVSTGDKVDAGREEWRWDEHFLGPAGRLFAGTPLYAVIGNHEEYAPIHSMLFTTPGGDGTGLHWSQEIAGVLLVGIDGRQFFAPGSRNYRWLEQVLAGSKARFIVVCSHFPAWASGVYGALDWRSGQVWSWEVRQARAHIVPLLRKYHVTAMIGGHEHFYERSVLPAEKDADGHELGELTAIVSGRAGAPLRLPKHADERAENPYSKVISDKLHYCLFEADGDTCTMKALTPDGTEIDSCRFKARTK